MNKTTNHRRYAVLAAVGVLALAGCGTATQPTGTGMHGGGATVNGGGMGYQYSRQTCAVPANLPGHVVTVTLADMGMTQMMGGTAPMGARMMLQATTTTAVTGQVTFVADNVGWRTHELVVLPLGAGVAAGQRVPGTDGKVTETGSLGEASANCAAGAGDGSPASTAGWVTLTLPPGTYELLCNLPNHYADGMHQEFTVTAN